MSTTAAPKLFGNTRNALLTILYGHTDRPFYLRELIRTTGSGHGALQRELQHLVDLGLVTREVRGNQVLYQANSHSPIFSEMRSLIAKTVGLHDTIRSALARLDAQIPIAFVYGSVARRQERSDSDVDLFIVGRARFSDVVSALGPAQKALGREINPTVFPISEFRSKLAAGNHFLRAVMKDKKLFVLGSQNELAKLAAK